MIKIYQYSQGERQPVYFNTFEFPGGEVQVQVGSDLSHVSLSRLIEIEAGLFNSIHILQLMHVVNAIRRRDPETEIKLICKYLPYARQDRVMNPGESLGIEVMCDLINAMNFSSVEVWDAHSDVSLALLKRVKHVEQHQLMQIVPRNTPYTIYVAPDAGALKKTLKTAKAYGRLAISAEKVRDVRTGQITGTTVHAGDLGDSDCLILDDICDGGRTFIELAKVLRQHTTGGIFLYVTHGIFSQGLDVFKGIIDHVYVANPFPGVDLDNSIITKLEYPRT